MGSPRPRPEILNIVLSVRRPRRPQRSPKILVVDDDPDVLDVAGSLLAELGYTVLKAHDSREALRLLETNRDIDLLFTDIVMPGPIDGFDLAERAAQLRPGLRVLYMSGYLRHEGVWPGSLLQKPWRRQDLTEAVREALA